MYNLEIGKEYLFSNGGKWVKHTLDVIGNGVFMHRVLDGSFWKHVKPLETQERKLYTQSMKDAGKPIEVGMWFKDYSDNEYECLLEPDEVGYAVYKSKGTYNLAYSKDVKPFPDPVKLIDCEAYEFEFDEYKEKGLYDGDGNLWVLGVSYNVENCTNIKHLTVKGE